MRSFTIMVDSNCDLPEEYLREHDIRVLPMPFHIDGKAYSGQWQEISGKEYYNGLRNGKVAGTTLINPETFAHMFEEYAAGSEDLLIIVLSSGLSSTFQNSVMALEDVRKKYPDCNIHTVDSISATSGVGLLVTLAVKKRGEGLSVSETAAWLDIQKHRCFGLFTVDDLMYLHRGGRLSKLSAVAGSIIGIKPILNLAPDGTLKLKDKTRGRKQAFETLVSQLKRSINPNKKLDTILINHTDCLEDAETFASMIKEAVDVQEVVVMLMGPVIGAHLGPGAITLIFEADMTRNEYEERFYKGAT